MLFANLFGHKHDSQQDHDHAQHPTQHTSTTLTRVRQIMGSIVQRSGQEVKPTDSFASLTGTVTSSEKDMGMDEDFLDLCALEVAIKQEFALEITQEENEQLFHPDTTAMAFAMFIDRHHTTNRKL